MLNCSIGNLPMVYLGIPMYDAHLGIKALSGIVAKTRRRLRPWKGKPMSWGRLILTISCLSSLPRTA